MSMVAWRKLEDDAKSIIPDMYIINDNMYYQTIPLKGVGNDKNPSYNTTIIIDRQKMSDNNC